LHRLQRRALFVDMAIDAISGRIGLNDFPGEHRVGIWHMHEPPHGGEAFCTNCPGKMVHVTEFGA
jgi:hypothetical protein